MCVFEDGEFLAYHIGEVSSIREMNLACFQMRFYTLAAAAGHSHSHHPLPLENLL
jgi:hypothetical protein